MEVGGGEEEASRAGWLGIVEMPNGSTGVTLVGFGIATPELATVDHGDIKEGGNAGFGEGGVDNQRFFTDSHPSTSLAVAPYETTSSLGVSTLGSVFYKAHETGQARGDGNTPLSADGHPIQSQDDSVLFQSQSTAPMQIIVDEDVALHTPKEENGFLVDEGAIDVTNLDIRRDFAPPGSDRTVSNLEAFNLQEVPFEPLPHLPSLSRERVRLIHGSTIFGGVPSLSAGEDQQILCYVPTRTHHRKSSRELWAGAGHGEMKEEGDPGLCYLVKNQDSPA